MSYPAQQQAYAPPPESHKGLGTGAMIGLGVAGLLGGAVLGEVLSENKGHNIGEGLSSLLGGGQHHSQYEGHNLQYGNQQGGHPQHHQGGYPQHHQGHPNYAQQQGSVLLASADELLPIINSFSDNFGSGFNGYSGQGGDPNMQQQILEARQKHLFQQLQRSQQIVNMNLAGNAIG